MNNSIYSSPFAHAGSSVRSIMLQVCLALVPCTAFGLYLFGWPAIFLFLVTCFAAIATEQLCLFWLKQPWCRVCDGSALLTGWLIAISLPPWSPWWVGVVGAFLVLPLASKCMVALAKIFLTLRCWHGLRRSSPSQYK